MTGHLSDEQLAAVIDGSLPEGSRASIEAHLGSCAGCAEALAREAAADQLMWEARKTLATCAVCGRAGAADAIRCGDCGAALRAGRFRVTGLVAKTERSRLYRAVAEAGRAVALKEVVLAPGSTERFAALEREARVLAELRHPRIPTFVAAFSEGEGAERRYYVAQELVEGESLLARMAHHRWDEREARAIARQVLEILVHLQGLSPPIFHRDVKPANLIVRSDATLSLVDFGAARDLGATQDGTLVGTFGYMPPEQLTGVVDATTDPYALGATLLHLLARRPPWELTGRADPTDAIAGSISSGFRGFLRRLLAPETSDRFPSAREALAALDAITGDAEDRAPRRRKALRRFGIGAGAFSVASVVGYAAFAGAQTQWMPGAPPADFTPLDKTFLLHAVAGGVLQVARLIIQLLGLGSHGADVGDGADAADADGHDGHDGDTHTHDGAGKLFTLHGVSAFLILFGLFGLALTRQSHAGGLLGLAGGLAAGCGGLLGVAALFRAASRLESSGTVDLKKAVGQEGTVYLTIPADGQGKIHVAVQSRLHELPAVTRAGVAIPTGQKVRVVMVTDPNVMVVEPIKGKE